MHRLRTEGWKGAKQLSGIQRFLILAMALGSLMPLSGMAQKCIYYPVPGEVVLSIDNNTSEEEAARVLGVYADKGLKLDKIFSETLLISLGYQPGMDITWLEEDPYVTGVRKTTDHVSVFFDSKVSDKYALDLIKSNPYAVIQDITLRNSRKARITIPPGQEQQWSETLSELAFVKDAAPVCASRYRATCERNGGEIVISGRNHESCRLPVPGVDWNAVLADKRDECRRSGGTWTVSKDTCIDDCHFEQDSLCWYQVTDYCDCGEYKCWYEKPAVSPGRQVRGTCIDNPGWLRRFNRTPSRPVPRVKHGAGYGRDLYPEEILR